MAKTVREVMNPELFSMRAGDKAAEGLGYIRALGITAVPVVDAEMRPLGVASFRDLLAAAPEQTLADRMTTPAVTIESGASLEDAAQMIVQRGVHRAVVVDDAGKVCGVVSALDLIAGILGLPAKHPDTFPHYDKLHAVTWGNDELLDLEHVEAAPDRAGVLLLVAGGKDKTERVIWAESAYNVRTRLYDLLSRPQDDHPELANLLQRHHVGLRFRATAIESEARRRSLAAAVMAGLRFAAFG
ncbi:MAG TPA: CBS domain-containing protein [Polyangiaceae bacterium]|nr:CBS domain-containing protein [Polyangiaceae bacterium]